MDGSLNESVCDESMARQRSSVDTLLLKDFVAKYRKSFPLRMRIEDGECSSDPDESFSSGDVYWLHLVKGTASVLIKGTEQAGYKDITVPVTNSSVEYGLVHQASDVDEKELLKGSIVKTAGDVMAMKPMPKVVCATKPHQTSKPDCSSVSASEILIIQEIKRVRIFGLRLKVYSVTEGAAKLLAPDCTAYFSTQPALTKLGMHTLLKRAKIELPALACLFSAGSEHIPMSLVNRVVTLEAIVEGAQSVLATNYVEGSEPTFVRPPSDYLHLPIDLPITVSLYREEAASDDAKSATVIEDRAYARPQEMDEVGEEQTDDGRICPPQATLMSLQEDLAVEFTRSVEKILSPPDAHVRHGDTKCDSSSEAEIHYARLNIATGKEVEVSHYDTPKRIQSQHQEIVKEHTYTKLKELKVKLDGLTVEQVSELLVTLDMGKHCKTFKKEKVNGSVLLFCTEDVLRDELRISSADERKRLLDIIKENNQSC
ncbi:hypothetical protein EMCRGX_G008095 [Ephydatia muelleri]|eukprot:Em0002g447a